MKFSHFFIDRPIFAMVLSLVTLLAGALAYLAMPRAQYPDIAPPTVQVTALYPGADPKVIADTVATPIEQEVNGVENMLYMSSRSTADGAMTLDVVFSSAPTSTSLKCWSRTGSPLPNRGCRRRCAAWGSTPRRSRPA